MRDALTIMVENINLHDDLKRLEEENGVLRTKVTLFEKNQTESILKYRILYAEKAAECDRWKKAYVDLARAFFSDKVKTDIEPEEESEGCEPDNCGRCCRYAENGGNCGGI